jgi:hypothetical protein
VRERKELRRAALVSSSASTVQDYLDELPPERREVISQVRKIILDHLPEGYAETMSWGMIGYGIPLERYPNTYNGQPLAYAALAAQKQYYALYLMGVDQDKEQEQQLRAAFERAGKKLNMGKSCLRFRKLDDLPLDVIGDVIAATTPAELIARYEASRKARTPIR